MQLFRPLKRFWGQIAPFSPRQSTFDEDLNNDARNQGRSQARILEGKTDMTQTMSLIPQKLVLKRGLLRNSAGQIGALYHKGRFLCYILEDPSRDVKIYGVTAIPAGIYVVQMQFGSARGRSMSQGARWSWHEDEVIELVDVDDFEYIQMHPGNRPADTLGCLLPGTWNGKSVLVGNSVQTYKNKIYLPFREHIREGLLHIEIIEG